MRQLTGPLLMVGAPQDMLDIRYATGFTAPSPVVYLQDGRKKILVVPFLEFERARRVAKPITVWAAEALPINQKMKGSVTGWALGLLQHLKINAVTVPGELPIAVADALRRARIRIQVATGPIFPQRQVKTKLELAHLVESQRAAVRALLDAVRYLARAQADHQGLLRVDKQLVTSELLRARINKTLLDHHCIGSGTIVAGGAQAADPHEIGFGPLRQGESIVMDIFPQHMEHGYWGDLTRTVVKGPPSAELCKVYRAVKRAHAAALSVVKAGVAAQRVHAAAVKAVRHEGFSNSIAAGKVQGFIHSTGHGVGLAIHEMPQVGLRPMRLKKGNVITIEPGLYYRDIGSVRIEDLIVVTASGWQSLAPCRYFFRI